MSEQDNREPLDPERVTWDAVIIGSGMGGGTLGYALARAGRRVLFVEKGLATFDKQADLLFGAAPEDVCDLARVSDEGCREQLLRGGRSPDPIEDCTRPKPSSFIPDLGCGTGGSSALYGMALERLFPADFHPRSAFADIDGSTLPESWPFAYADLEPWYAKAEALYRVRGSADPMRPAETQSALLPPAPFTPANQEMFDFLSTRGLHPYALHVGCETVSNCPNCQAVLCPRECKNDAGRICVQPAVAKYGASLLTECTTIGLEADRSRVTTAVCQSKGRTIRLRGKYFVLAAGALVTPSILLNSTSAEWPAGVANTSGHVGRNYMRHMVDLYVVKPRCGEPIKGQIKEIAFNDFYQRNDRKYGTVQSFGELPGVARVLNRPSPGLVRKLLRVAAPIASPVWDRCRSNRLVFAAIMEDLPYADNRILPPIVSNGEFRVRLSYTVREHERVRLKEFRSMTRDALRPYRPVLMKGAQLNRAVAHACGTCRSGDDGRTSVVNAEARTHDLDNLYIADASIFPSSGGINPALTIAGNALRIAAHINTRF